LALIPIISLFIGVCGGAVLLVAIAIIIVTLVFERVNKNKAGAIGHRAISDYTNNVTKIENATLRKAIEIKNFPSSNERLTVTFIKLTLLPILKYHRDVLKELTYTMKNSKIFSYIAVMGSFVLHCWFIVYLKYLVAKLNIFTYYTVWPISLYNYSS